MDGLLPFQEFLEAFDRSVSEPREYPNLHTFLREKVAGAADVTSVVRWKGLRMEIVDMDGSRVDKVLVRDEEVEG